VWDELWLIAPAAALVALQAILIAILLENRRRLSRAHAERRHAEQAAHELSGRMIYAQEEERSRLARELHDDVTQRLALLAIEAGHEERNFPASAAGSAMRTMREGLVRLSEDVHALSYRLHPSILEDLGLIEALKSECDRFSRACDIRLDANVPDIPARLPRDVALCLFRIAQEGLRNIARHAAASRVEVRLRRLGGGLQLVVKDNGTGFDTALHRTRMSLGHASMRQRVFVLGGNVDIESSHGHGTMIVAWVPLKEAHSEPSARAAG
jgi:signal transduction histidine kinase